MKNNDEFLNKFRMELDNGEYDEHLTLPFMKKDLLYATVKDKVEKKIEKDQGTGLSDIEITNTIEEVKETAGGTFYLMVKHNIIEKKEDGSYGLTKRGAIAISEVSRKRIKNV